MKVLKRVAIGLLLIIAIAAIAMFIYLQTTKPVYDGELHVDGLGQSVDVWFDDYGVPHIYAQNARDAYFTLGYVHAQERLFQMEMIRRAAGGRLAEVLGSELLPVDKFFRTLGLNEFARRHARQFLSSDTLAYQEAALSYQRGVNAYIAYGKTPVEFTVAGIPKTPFTPEDIYLAVSFMSVGFAEALQVDPVFQKILSERGAGHLRDLLVPPPDRMRTFDGAPKAGIEDSLIVCVHHILRRLPVPLWQGSNAAVVAGQRTASGFPILTNDTHIGFGQPAVWFEAHVEYPGFSFYGHHLAGFPFALLGNNRRMAWGLTMFENDDMDFFIETVNPRDSNQVKFNDRWETMSVRQEVIGVKGKNDVVLEVKSSRHGPIVNGVLDYMDSSQPPVALSWVLLRELNEDLQASYNMCHAKDFMAMRQAAAQISAPGLNVLYADVEGNIAWWAVAKLPIRPPHVRPHVFLDGASGNDEYLGYYDFSRNPHAVNPPAGYIASNNNPPDSVRGVRYPGYYYNGARAQRMNTLLAVDKKWTTNDVKAVLADVVSPWHRRTAQEIAAVLQTAGNPRWKALVTALQSWNGDHRASDVAPSVYYNMLAHIMAGALRDELGDKAYQALLGTAVLKNCYTEFIRNDSSAWWDNVHTTKKESRADIIAYAAEKTVANLQTTSGDSPSSWTWGKIHTLTHSHPLGAVKPLDKIFNVGPYPVDGGVEVLNNLSFSLDTTGYFPVTSGPALRKITDMADVESGVTVSPSGQSGNVMSRFYDDQAEMFATNQYRPMLMNKKVITTTSKKHLVLLPAPQR